MVIFLLFGSLAILLLLNIPIAVSMGLSTFFAIIFGGISIPLTVIPQRIFTSIDSFPFMAIPFFMLAGSLMEKGGISSRLVNFAKAIVGMLPGGLGLVSVFSSAFFGAISGSNAATVSAIGSVMIPSMTKEKYPKDYACALNAAAGTLGVVVPPSVPMITYCIISNVSIGTMFISGLIPALLMILTLSITIIFVSGKYGAPQGRNFSLMRLWKTFLDALLALLMPIIILGGIYGGIFTPTEAAAVACIYSLIVTLFIYREIKVRDLYSIFISSAKNASIIFFIIATSSAFSWLLTSERIPSLIASTILSITNNKIFILMLMNLLFLILGVFLETNAIILLMTPMLLPVAVQIGVDPLAFGIIMVVNTSIGMLTPPMAVNIVVACGIGKAPIEDVSKKVIPFFLALIIDIIILTYVPDIILFLPRLLGRI